jgi:hypothetical protein
VKFTRHEKRLFDKLAYYTCLGTQYPYEKQTRMLWLIGLAIVFGAPLVGVIPPNIDRLKPLTLPIFLIYMSIIFVLILIGIKRGYFPGEKLQHEIKLHRSGYIREYNILKQENPGLTVEAFAESIKVFLTAQEKQRTQQEKRESEQELAELKQKYDL